MPCLRLVRDCLRDYFRFCVSRDDDGLDGRRRFGATEQLLLNIWTVAGRGQGDIVYGGIAIAWMGVKKDLERKDRRRNYSASSFT